MGQFNTQDDTGDAHMVNTPKLMLDFSMSNYIVINADHGMPTGTVTFSSSDLPDLHPSISFGVSCSVSLRRVPISPGFAPARFGTATTG